MDVVQVRLRLRLPQLSKVTPGVTQPLQSIVLDTHPPLPTLSSVCQRLSVWASSSVGGFRPWVHARPAFRFRLGLAQLGSVAHTPTSFTAFVPRFYPPLHHPSGLVCPQTQMSAHDMGKVAGEVTPRVEPPQCGLHGLMHFAANVLRFFLRKIKDKLTQTLFENSPPVSVMQSWT